MLWSNRDINAAINLKNNVGRVTSEFKPLDLAILIKAFVRSHIDISKIKKGTLYAIECKYGKEHKLSELKGFKELEGTEYNKAKCSVVCTTDSLSALSDKILLIPVKSI